MNNLLSHVSRNVLLCLQGSPVGLLYEHCHIIVLVSNHGRKVVKERDCD